MGANGKAATPVAAPPRSAVPAPTSAATSASTATGSRQNGSAVRVAAAAVTPAPKPAASPRVEEFPVIPSNDFLKWMAESLKGLNSSVNCTCDERCYVYPY